MLSAGLLGASTPPAGGAAISDVIYATAGAMVATVLLFGPILLYKLGRFPPLGRLADARGTATEPPRLGGAARHLPRRDAPDRGLRHVLGHLPAHRPGPRPGAAREPSPLLHPRRALRRAARRRARPRPLRQADADLVRDRARLARADRRADDHGLRGELAGSVPARRHLAPDLRPGRDALGADPPDADRRRLALGARRLGAPRRGR